MRRAAGWIAFATITLLLTEAFALTAPWRRRRRPDIRSNRRATALVLPDDWPAEPASPETVDPERFAQALRQLCGWMPPERPRRYADLMIRYADEFSVDPFVIGALSHRMGRCRPDAESLGGLGLTLIPRRMYGDFVRRGTYRYWVHKDEEWQERTLDVSRFPFSEHRLRRAEENIYFASAFLRVWQEQSRSLNESFEQHPHRHPVSHMVWGDRVISDRAEDRVLTDRRRLLQYYGATPVPVPAERLGLSLGPPLDGVPRVVSSWIGADRDEGARRHRGIDVESVLGEPVYAVADGRVNFAGVDFPGARRNENMTRRELEAVPRQQLGRGGRYVCILHRPSGEDAAPWIRSCYMHLEDVEVQNGQDVRRGDRIGTVGRTGMISSAPHLHFELHSPDGLVDGSEVLSDFLIGRRPEEPPRRRRRR
ncbi:MAG: M23 family metallopeptidase [Myxococcota bacterium]